jgi:glutamate racemase
VLGPTHYALITKLNYLGRCLKRMGMIDESAACYARSAGILRQLRENNAAALTNAEPAATEPAEIAGMLG